MVLRLIPKARDNNGNGHTQLNCLLTGILAAALTDEAMASLKQEKEMHDKPELLYNPHVNFGQLYRIADRVAEELLRDRRRAKYRLRA